MSKIITLLGSTGSIGTQSLDVIRAQGYQVFGLSAHRQVETLLRQIEEFHPKVVCMDRPGRQRPSWTAPWRAVPMRPGC